MIRGRSYFHFRKTSAEVTQVVQIKLEEVLKINSKPVFFPGYTESLQNKGSELTKVAPRDRIIPAEITVFSVHNTDVQI